MSQSLDFHSLKQLELIEQSRNSRLLILAASNLDMEILPALFSQLKTIGRVKKLDVLIHSRGGIVNAARRIALLLRKFTDHLSFIVPYHCESSATILVLSADEIIAGDLAIFSPIDPHLHGDASSDGQTTALSCQDIKEFGLMSQAWFGVDSSQANAEQLSLLCNSIFPPTLTTFYRTASETQKIAEELIAYQLPDKDSEFRSAIVKELMFNFHSHHYAITTEEMLAMGLKCQREPNIEQLSWEISTDIQKIVGGGVRETLDAPWNDALLLSREGAQVRRNQANALMPKWVSVTV